MNRASASNAVLVWKIDESEWTEFGMSWTVGSKCWRVRYWVGYSYEKGYKEAYSSEIFFEQMERFKFAYNLIVLVALSFVVFYILKILNTTI